MTLKPIVIYDGQCNLCEGAVRFIIERDPEAKLLFISAESPLAAALQKELAVQKPEDDDTLVLIRNGEPLLGSDAALAIAADLNGGWRWLYHLHKVPKSIREPLYRFIARRRYRWFGRNNKCLEFNDAISARFLH